MCLGPSASRILAVSAEHNVDLARYLADRCRDADDFEHVEPQLSVVCFRHVPSDVPPARLDAYQVALQRALEVDGSAWVSTTTLRGRTYLRAGMVNYLATERDVGVMIDAIRRLSPGALSAS